MITAFFRTLILYILLMAGLRLTGKRQIGELEPSELVLALIISDLASVPMQDFGIPLINGVIPILLLFSFTLLISFFSLKSVRFRSLVCGNPILLIRDGRILQDNMARTRYTIDELYEQLRTQGYPGPDTVKYAVLETNGQLSVLPYTKDAPLTAAIAQLPVTEDSTLPMILIKDGHLLRDTLRACGRNKNWLYKELQQRRLTSPKQVFLMTIDEEGSILCIPKAL